ncbi:MAG: hypothetical protein IJ996_02580 [Clostridia bacterium]|nr:hypothetical protein [Clostridia bacterium]
MLTVLQIVFTILSVLCVTAVIPIGTFFGFANSVFCVLGACVFFVLMLLCKNKREQNEPTTQEELVNENNEQEN